MKKLLLFLLLLQSIMSSAATYQVGPSRDYVSPNALYAANIVQDGDIIEIDAETYTGQAALAVWQANNLIIRGIGRLPHMVANGEYIWGKGIWVLAGNNITVENIEFSGATVPDQNGAGIRLDGTGLTVRHCYFHDNENGILTNNSYDGDILIEYSEFNHNGYGDGFSHNLYIGHVNKLTFRFNYTHHADIGHNLKSRANENYILYNRIMDEETGTSSRLIDLSNGGFSIIMGNLLMQGNNAPNNNLVGYGKEGLSNTLNELYFINNTLVNKRTASCLFLDIKEGTSIANVSNNIFAGSGTIDNGTTTITNNNLIEPNIADIQFMDEQNYNYDINPSSLAMDYGVAIDAVNGYSLTPDFVYLHPLSFFSRPTVNQVIDAGAYEYSEYVNVSSITPTEVAIYPNPATNKLFIDLETNEIEDITIYNSLGQFILKETSNTIDLSSLNTGIYPIVIKKKNGEVIIDKIIKQ